MRTFLLGRLGKKWPSEAIFSFFENLKAHGIEREGRECTEEMATAKSAKTLLYSHGRAVRDAFPFCSRATPDHPLRVDGCSLPTCTVQGKARPSAPTMRTWLTV